MMHVVDRPFSLSVLVQRRTGIIGNARVLGTDLRLGNTDNSVVFDAMVDIIKQSERGKVSAESEP